MNARIHLLVAVLLIPAWAQSASSQDKSWVGENVQIAKPYQEIKIAEIQGGKEVYFPLADVLGATVRDERDGRLLIHDSCRQGWVDKADFVLVQDALDYFNRRLQANPQDIFALYNRGANRLERGDLDAAISDFTECIRIRPTDAAVYNSRGIAFRRNKRFDDARGDFDEAIRLDPAYSLAFVSRGDYWHLKKDYDKAIGDFDEAIRINPDYVVAYRERGAARTEKKEYDRAISLLKKAKNS